MLKSWSQLATKVEVSWHFYGEQNTSERETYAALNPSHFADDRGLGHRGRLFQLRTARCSMTN